MALMLLGSAAAAVAPWLWYTNKVWGSPFRSDVSYALLQNYYAHKSYSDDVNKFWRTLRPPPSLGAILNHDAAGFARYLLHSIVIMPYMTAAEIGGWRSELPCCSCFFWRCSQHGFRLVC